MSTHKSQIIQELAALGEDLGLETALFQQKIAAKIGLSVNDLRALSIIIKQGESGITATDLSRKLRVTNGAVTGITARLAKKDLIYKSVSEADQRSSIIRPNLQNIRANGEDYARMGHAFQELLDSYSVEELAIILDYSRRTLQLTKLQSFAVDQETELVA